MPRGTAIAVAAPVMTSVPTIAGSIPPPESWSKIGGSWVRKLQPNTDPPLPITKATT